MPDDAGRGVVQPRGLFVAVGIVIVLTSVRAAATTVVPVIIAVLVTVVAAPFQRRSPVTLRIDITPLWGMLSLVFWGWLLGPAGAILAIPLTMLAKFLLESSPVTTPLARLMAPVTVTDT